MYLKTLLKLALGTALAFSLAVCSHAEFAKTKNYESKFADVKENAWYANDLKVAYELGFIDGVSEERFSPDGTVTVSQAITLASRIHAQYYGEQIPTKNGGNWYDMYIDYAKKCGFVSQDGFDSYTREIMRYEMAILFCDALPKEYYNAINNVKYIPDIPVGSSYTDKVLVLYNAGVLMGNDEYGTFKPNESIKRKECCAIVSRLAIKENRIQKTLLPFTSDNAYVLCYNVGMNANKETVNSGWVLDNRGGSVKLDTSSIGSIGDVSEKYPTRFIREFNYIPKGEVVLEISFAANRDGAYLEYKDVDGNSVYSLKIVNGKWCVLLADGKYEEVYDALGDINVRAVINLDEKISTTYINDVGGKRHSLLSDNIMSFEIGMDEKGTGSVAFYSANMVVNYSVYDDFDLFGANEVYGWETQGNVNVSSGQLEMRQSSSAKKNFDGISGNVCTETYFISKDGKDFKINVGNSIALSCTNSKLYANEKEVYTITKNMWYRLRVETDTNDGVAKILLNGRKIGTVKTSSCEPVSFVSFSNDGNFAIDNLKVYNLYEYADYVPEPNAECDDEYLVGMNICSLWRNGTHYGWGCISAYDEPTPLIGYYDEGNPESADWEIKFMVEHGVDFQAFCWYADSSTGPLKNPANSEQLHNGYMYAKYSDRMKYCILWEASNASHFNSNQFRNYVVPYWFENYFLDERYQTVNNKLLLPIFGAWQLSRDDYFGSAEGVKKEFDYLENKAKEYGFDGFVFLYCGSADDYYAKMGFDGCYAYNWGTAGKSLEVNKNNILSSAKNKNLATIPTISTGFDSIPWHDKRYGNMTCNDFEKGLCWIKDEYLPTYAKQSADFSNLVWLSTWNEYGEGTYIMPSGLCGFGYLDAVRDTFTHLSEEHTDTTPTLKQRERINHLYPQYAHLLRREGWYYYNRTDKNVQSEPKNKLYINDVDIQNNCDEAFFIPPMVKDSKVLFAFNPSSAVNFILGCHYEWRKEAGTLKIIANGHEVLYEVGKSVYTVDSTEKELGFILETFDGLPMLDYEALANDLGYKSERRNGDVYIYTDRYDEMQKTLSKRKTGIWEFNDNYDNEGFSSSSMNLMVNDGSMKMTTIGTTNDPIATYAESAFPTDFYTKRYTQVSIRCRYDYTTPDGLPSIIAFYYATDRDGSFDEKKCIKLPLENLSSNGEWVTLTYDLTKETYWQTADYLIALRFDPFNGHGEMEIDYIRFKEDEKFVYIPPEEREIEIVNGSADEEVNFFFSDNATITRVKDTADNYAWNVKTSEGPNYTYFRTSARFKENTSYSIEFDIRLIGNNSNGKSSVDSTSFFTNFRYADKGAYNDFDHIVRSGISNISVSDGWVHYSATYTTGKIDSHESSEFSVYTNPAENYGFSFRIDNITVREIKE